MSHEKTPLGAYVVDARRRGVQSGAVGAIIDP